ncbi:MAG TPA: aldo/keto reductase [Syntrophorhabdaceae bacterium]|jgi:predicted aldo/keto reductase-like oxidoreductase
MTLLMDRRDFVKTVAVTTGAAMAEHFLSPIVHAVMSPGSNTMMYRTLGHTGERVSVIGLGGWHIGQPSLPEQDSIRLIRQAVDRGINFLDNCWDYNEGASEVRMGVALKDGYRQKVFLMTKIDGRTRAEAARQIDTCLRRLQTDHVDLMQFHEVIRLEDPDRIFAEGGAVETMVEAQKAGKVRYIGFTGHKDPFVHLRMLELARKHNFHFDAVQMPLNVMDAHFRSFEHEVLPVLNREGIAPIGMKAFGGHAILQSQTVRPVEALHFCFNLPIAVQITGIDSQQVLDQAFEAVRTFKPFTPAELESLLKRTRPAALEGRYELYKTSTRFDGTQQHPDWIT